MIGTIAPIQTRYRGILFRSRTESRWARLFDALSLPWFYEYEGYALSEWYLPDFWLTSLQVFAEVKGVDFTESETRKCAELAIATGHPVVMLPGPPAYQEYEQFVARDGEAYLEPFTFPGDYLAAVEVALSERFERR